MTENDESSGQQHTWFRKLETQAGRWTSTDPYKGSMQIGAPQSFNRYSYVENDPVNFVDPSGLCSIVTTINANGQITSTATSGCTVTINGEGQSPVSGGGGIFGDGVFLPEEGPGEGIDIGGGSVDRRREQRDADSTLGFCIGAATATYRREAAVAWSNFVSKVGVAVATGIIAGVAGAIKGGRTAVVAAALAFGAVAYGALVDYGVATAAAEDKLVQSGYKCIGDARRASSSALAAARRDVNSLLKPTNFRRVRDLILRRTLPLIPTPPRRV